MNRLQCVDPYTQRNEIYQKKVPKAIQCVAFIHLWSLLSCIVSLSAADIGCSTTDDVSLSCIGINSTDDIPLHSSNVNKLIIRESFDLFFDELLERINISFIGLESLSIQKSGVSQVIVNETNELSFTSSLKKLDLSNNQLVDFEWGSLTQLEVLNLSSNLLKKLNPSVFEDMTNLKELHISHNLLDKSLISDTFFKLSKSLTLLNISENKFQCSPELSWIYDWNLKTNAISDQESVQCHYDNSNYNGNILLVMEYYSKFVNPSCPSDVGCTCALLSVQEKMVHSTDRTYSVQVNCADNGLNFFPKLPKHTRSVDISGNLINVDNLTINDNKLESLPEKILEMKLGLSFSARNNKLETISYDMSQRLVRITTVVELSGNPWICSCRSQITDVILIEKVRDKTRLICGPNSDGQLQNEKIMSLNPQILCAPAPSGEVQETFLKLLCVLLAILIVIVFTKLGYDYWVYRTRGQLPWLVLKMP
ncbi:unnamed protein product [Lepeophtheirus salmonis]|uniref:(salmon louse) hypothetical protein n=1 Tax=Lepeophtheirus salmonis TaxID=72036 RepID=A0A7R8CBJ7_LEPSM|nr:unnamed protein product [Lepeophtheirus salmonis]CAF2761295.1 unnamed protein product [Lepeophtheirus salmonis]